MLLIVYFIPGAFFDWFSVNPLKKKEKRKKNLRISLKTLFIDFVLVI